MTTFNLPGVLRVEDRARSLDRPAWDDAAETESVAIVRYVSDDGRWVAEVERELLSPAGGPTAIRLVPLLGGEAGALGGYDSDGIQLADLRSVPLSDARRQLETVWIEHRARQVIAAIPEDFSGERAFATLAQAMVALHEWNVRNPVGVIARYCEPHTHGTWATRVKRARERGYLTQDAKPSLTGKALVLLRS